MPLSPYHQAQLRGLRAWARKQGKSLQPVPLSAHIAEPADFAGTPLKTYMLDAGGVPLNPALIMGERFHAPGATKVFMHPDQVFMWGKCAVEANATKFDPNQFPDVPKQITCGGLPIIPDSNMRHDWVEFRNDLGDVLVRIENLAVPPKPSREELTAGPAGSARGNDAASNGSLPSPQGSDGTGKGDGPING